MSTTPKLVIFDCDGVLVDSEPIAARVLANYISANGRATTADECLELFTGLSLERVLQIINDEWRLKLPANFISELRALDRVAFEKDLKPLPNAENTIKLLQEHGIKVCVASSGSIEKITHSLSITNLLDLFDGNIFSASFVTNGKPAPDLFLFSANKMGVSPSDTVVVEDSPAGIIAGRNASMRVFGFTGGSHAHVPAYLARINDAKADTVFSAMHDLPALLGI